MLKIQMVLSYQFRIVVRLELVFHSNGQVDHLSTRQSRVSSPKEPFRRALGVVVASHDQPSGRVRVQGGDDIAEVFRPNHCVVSKLICADMPLQAIQSALD